MARWDPEQVDEVGGLLDQLHPYFETPLVEAMRRAANTDLASAQGLKNLLVLTDGNDNGFAKSGSLNPGSKLTIPAFVADRFRERGIRITVVYFRAAGLNDDAKKQEDAEVQTARENFKPLLAAGAARSVRRGQEPRPVDREPQGGPRAEARLPDPRCAQDPRGRARRNHARRDPEVVGRRAGRGDLHAPRPCRPAVRAGHRPQIGRPADRRAGRRRQRRHRLPPRALRRRGRIPGVPGRSPATGRRLARVDPGQSEGRRQARRAGADDSHRIGRGAPIGRGRPGAGPARVGRVPADRRGPEGAVFGPGPALARADDLPGAGLATRRAAMAGRPRRSRPSRAGRS